MRGRVGKRGKSWFYVVDVGQTEDGKRKQSWRGGFPTRGAAQDALNEILNRLQQNNYVEKSKQTLGEFLHEWLTGAKVSLRPSTWSSYEANLALHVKPSLGSVKLQALTPAGLNALYADLLAGGRSNGKGGLSARTVRYIHTILRKALMDAVRWGKLARNPADFASPPAARAARAPSMNVWTGEQVAAFLEHVQDDRLYAAWVVAATTGMRRGEVLGLRWEDVDLNVGRVAIRRALIAVHYEMSFSEPKTPKSRRSVSLDPVTVHTLREHRRNQLEERLAWGPAYQDQGLVFCRENGSPIHPDWFSKVFDRHVRAAGLPDIRVHDLRHTHATMALAAGVHPKVVSERLGHSTISLTMDTYSHAIPAMEEEAASRVANLIFAR